MDIGILLLRVTIGLTLAAHGGQKLFGWFGGPGLRATGQGMETLGFTPGRRHALMAGLAELGGGLLFALGLFTPLAATIVASVMLVAGVSAHARNGFFMTRGGYEYTLIFGMAGLAVAFTGPGALSLDALAGQAVNGAVWGVGALVVAAGGAVVQLAQRRSPRAAAAA